MPLPECLELDAVRLQKNWTWAELAEQMKRVDLAMSPRTLHYIVKRMPPDATPRDRTLFRIRKFLEHVRASRARQQRRASRRRRVS
jgi:hypothetical protein